MSSIIKKLIQDNKAEIQRQDNWKETSVQKQFQASKCLKLGEQLINLIVIGLTSNNSIDCLTEARKAKKKSCLLQNLSKKHNISENNIQRILGLYVKSTFDEGGSFQRLFKQSDAFYETDDEDEEDIDEDEEDISTNFYTRASVNQSNTLFSLQQKFQAFVDDDLTSVKSFRRPSKQESRFSQLNFDLSINKSHDKTVEEYLSTLAAPQTEMMNLCGQFNWKGYFRDRARGDEFQVFAIIDFQYKKCSKQLVESAVYKNKKSARIIAAFKMLRKLYLSFPEIWEEYSRLRMTGKSLEVSKADLETTKILRSRIEEDRVEVIKIEKEKSREFEKEVSEYLSQIDKFKTEMNVLLQQITGTFTHPKMEKMNVNNLWKVKGVLVFRDPITNNSKEYIDVVCNKSAKDAEEIVAKSLLTKMYKDNQSILQRMAMIKAKKGIKT